MFVCLYLVFVAVVVVFISGEKCLLHEREAGLTQVTEEAPPLHQDSQHVRPELPELQRRQAMLTVMIITVTFFFWNIKNIEVLS